MDDEPNVLCMICNDSSDKLLVLFFLCHFMQDYQKEEHAFV